ncbi:hypothetical protein D1007_45993 [Hordeum vulgare]|nr:hypothetical protein D1007_45993 [Hordeum vulgare]
MERKVDADSWEMRVSALCPLLHALLYDHRAMGTEEILRTVETVVMLDDGDTTSLWHCMCLNGRQLCIAYPLVFASSIRKNRTVREALHGDRWVLDLRPDDYNNILQQVPCLACKIRQARLVLEDVQMASIRWTLNSSGQYSTHSAYHAQFADYELVNFRSTIWKVWAPCKIKMFLSCCTLMGFGAMKDFNEEDGKTTTSVSSVCEASRPPSTSSGSA